MGSAWLWSRARLAINKKQKYFSLPYHQLAENQILVFGLLERKKRGHKQICNKICRNFSYNYFHIKISLKLLVKRMLHSAFSLTTWITKFQIKQPAESPEQIFPNYGQISWKAFALLRLFSRLSGFPDLSGKIFLITFKFS